ncbi:hypothetical protein RDI58_028671 [Solanum bulbocastanum]|uniref:Uncharacterized protein n=1 Tax=Solanum bulbocastanum TaxID=147425 RepID=A0AAN8SQM6_SOLBU
MNEEVKSVKLRKLTLLSMEDHTVYKVLSSDMGDVCDSFMQCTYFKDSNFLPRRKFDITCFENSYARDFVKYAAEQFGRDHQEIANEVSLGTVSAGTDCDSFEKEEGNDPASRDYYSEEFKVFRRERTKEISEKLDKYKELEKGMTCKDIQNLEELYAIANGKSFKIEKSNSESFKIQMGC